LRGVAWLVEAVESGRFRDASPIGFYFAKLWYFEKLYPIIFTVAALGRAVRVTSSAPAAGSA
jgi:squalene-hopene/tetraprenyl-beta-curcumene cyclase